MGILCLPSQLHTRILLDLYSKGFVHAIITTVISCIQLPCYVWKILFSWCNLSTTSGFYSLFHPSSMTTLEPWGKDCCMYIPFRPEYFTVFYFLHFEFFRVFVLIVICGKENLLWWSLRYALTYGYGNKLLGIMLLLYPFSRIIVLGHSYHYM